MKRGVYELIRATLAAMALLLAVAWAGAAPVPVTALPIPDGYDGSQCRAVNESGQIAGYCITADNYWRACIWDGGACTIIDVADGVLDDCIESESIAINASGQVIGVCYDENYDYHGFIWQNGVMTALGALPGLDFSYPMAINDAGQVVGNCYNASDYLDYGFLWENGAMTPLVWTGVDRDGNSAQFPIDACDINAAGQVVGGVEDPLDLLDYQPAVLWEAGAVTVLTPGANGYAPQINNNGWVVGQGDWGGNPWLYVPGAGLRTLNVSGQYPDGDFEYAYSLWPQGINDLNQVLIYAGDTSSRGLWIWEDDGSADGAFTEIPLWLLLAPGEVSRYMAGCLNNAGQVAGYCNVPSPYRECGFFWDASTPAAIAELARLPGDASANANAINDASLIAGATYYSNYHPCTWNAAATPANQAPVANAGPDQTIYSYTGSTSAQLDGTGSADPDGDACRYAWSENGTPLATGARPSVTLAEGVHVITLTVTDTYGASSSDTVTITMAKPPSALTVTVTSVARKGKSIVVMAEIRNTQPTEVTDVTVTEATLGGVNTTSRLPLAVRKIKANRSKSCTFKFDGAAVPVGPATFWLNGTSSMGAFYTGVTVTVP